MRRLVIALKSLVMAACAAALFGVITWLLRQLDPLIPVALPGWAAFVGVALMAVGGGLALACFWTFASAGALSPHARFPDPEGLITWGPFRYARNPMTKGGWTVLCGWGLFQLSPAVLALALVMAALAPVRRAGRGAEAGEAVRGQLPRVQAAGQPLGPLLAVAGGRQCVSTPTQPLQQTGGA